MNKNIQNLLNKWPNAVPSDLVCMSEEDKQDRATGIMELLAPKGVKDLKVLDFGCGEGHFAKLAADSGANFVVGYDLAASDSSAAPFECIENNLLLTSSVDKLENKAPYDFIVMYDVLDHCDTPIKTLSQVSNLLAHGGILNMRCHPYCGRHGGHQYKQTNKAFLHLILDDKELKAAAIEPVPAKNRILFPVVTYRKWIANAGLEIVEQKIVKQKVEPFFATHPAIKNKILKKFHVEELPIAQMEISFVDFFLQKK
jgi:2-polyprenyl-3-methyl-5-hydroxy-6-metoxy-1,4-benzoquinol methylase